LYSYLIILLFNYLFNSTYLTLVGRAKVPSRVFGTGVAKEQPLILEGWQKHNTSPKRAGKRTPLMKTSKNDFLAQFHNKNKVLALMKTAKKG